jgi:Predicted membrane protein (DUF2178)
MSRWSNAAERNRAVMEAKAERILADTTYDRMRTPTALRALIVVYVAVTVGMAVLWLAAGTLGGTFGMLAWIPVFVALRVAVRSQADLPDDVLDERMRATRNEAYVHAFRLTAGLVFTFAAIIFVAVAFRPEPVEIKFEYSEASAIFWTLFSVLVGAPSLAMAKLESDRRTGSMRLP